MQHINSLPHPPKPTNPAKAANATKTDSKHLPQKCTQNSKQFTKKKTKPISQKHTHTLRKGFRAGFGIPILATVICVKNMQERQVCAF
jgi:hypothetical protein